MTDTKKPKAKNVPEAVRPQNLSVGETLRAAREAKKLSVEEAAAAIHIRVPQMRAIEENNMDGLPGMTYAVGFVRSYANYLGLNGAEIVKKFKAEHGQEPAGSNLSFPEPIAESRMPDPLMVGIGAFLAVLVLVVWSIYTNVKDGDEKAAADVPAVETVAENTDTTIELPAAAPAEPAAAPVVETPVVEEKKPQPLEEKAETVVKPAVDKVATEEKKVAEDAGEKPAVTEEKKSEEAKVADKNTDDKKIEDKKLDEKKSDETAAATPETEKPAKEENVINIKKGKGRVVLQATQASWIQVTDSKQEILQRKVLRPGEQYYVPDRPGISLVTANAGGLDIFVDGQKVQPIGKPGEIVRGIALDPAQLKQKRIKVRD